MRKCLNCNVELIGKFCYECGQQETSGRLTIKSLFKDFIHSFFHWESTVINTIKELAINPREFIKKFIGGKRKPYSKPISFFVLILTLFIIVFHLLNEPYLHNINKADTGIFGINVIEFKHFVSTKVNYFCFLLPPIFAFYFFIFSKSLKINYAESLVVAFYLLGFCLLISIFWLPFSFINAQFYYLKFIITFSYLVYAIIKFIDTKFIKSFFKPFAIVFLSYITYIVVVATIAILYISIKH